MGVRNTAMLDPVAYGRLCADVLPTVIASKKEFDRLAARLEELDMKDNPTREEKALADVLAKLVTDYDEANHRLPDVPPHKMIAFLLEQHGLKASDLLSVFGSRGAASDVISGKRPPSKAHVKALAARFHVSADLFL
jgi:HTH-type transcriptional regulator/antitoxin HigA